MGSPVSAVLDTEMASVYLQGFSKDSWNKETRKPVEHPLKCIQSHQVSGSPFQSLGLEFEKLIDNKVQSLNIENYFPLL